MMSRFAGQTIGVGGTGSKLKPMERKVKENPRYANVKSGIDTGASVNKVQYISQGQYIKRTSEIFFRISPPDLYQLYAEYEKHADENMRSNGGGGGGGGGHNGSGGQNIASFASGGGGPRIVVHEEEAQVTYEQPYLILDLRTPEDFEACHLLQARSFPQRLLMQDKSTVELHRYRNAEGKLIVLYDDCERLAAAAAHQLVHRGYENVFVLTGGLASFGEKFPDR